MGKHSCTCSHCRCSICKLELSSAVSGKDWISGRELGTAECWTRGLLAPVESFRLDYTSWDGTRPYPKDGGSYAMIRFKTSRIDEIEILYGEKFGGLNTDGPPCTQNGITGSRNYKIVPEWEFIDRFKPLEGAELYQVINGNETLVA